MEGRGAAGLMHLAPEAFETQRAVYKGTYPLAGLFIVTGFFLFFTLQRVVAPLLATTDAPVTLPTGSCCVAMVPLPVSCPAQFSDECSAPSFQCIVLSNCVVNLTVCTSESCSA